MVARMRPLRLALLLLAPLLACGDDARLPVGATPPPPATTGLATTGDPTAAEATTSVSACGCGPDEFCVAVYDPGNPQPPLEAFECRTECLGPGAPGFWCFDDTSCCGEGVCRSDGLCERPASVDGTTTTDGTGTGTTDATGTGTTEATDTGTGTTDAPGTGTGTGSTSTT
jgi:hypothetical protein